MKTDFATQGVAGQCATQPWAQTCEIIAACIPSPFVADVCPTNASIQKCIGDPNQANQHPVTFGAQQHIAAGDPCIGQ
jgi:hypothetical protein